MKLCVLKIKNKLLNNFDLKKRSSFVESCKTIRLQTLILGAFATLFALQIVAKLVVPQVLNRLRWNSDSVVKIKEAEIDLAELFSAYNRQLALIQLHNETVYHDFRVNVNETTSTITISSSILTANGRLNLSNNISTSHPMFRSMQISSVKIRMANLSNADLILSTQFITTPLNTSSVASDRHKEFVEL